MKLLIKLYSNSFCCIIKAEGIEIKSNKILVHQLKEQISAKFNIPKSEQILTIKYDNNKKNNLITLSDEFPLYYFFIHNNSELFLEHYKKIDKTKEICEKIQNSKSKKLRHLKYQIFSNNQYKINSKKNLGVIKESDNEYNEHTEIDSKNNDEMKNAIIDQAIQFIIENKVTQFKEYIYINEFIQEDLSVLTNKNNGWNALHYSCYYGGEQMTDNLIKIFNPSEKLINGLTNDGYTPLHLACIKGHINIVRILLFLKEINVNINQNKDGTPLHIACKRNDMQIVAILVSFKADLLVRNSLNKLPIELTTDENIRKILKKAMIYTFKEDESSFIREGEEDLSLYVDNLFTPPKPPITIGYVDKRGQIFPTYSTIFIEVNPTKGFIKKYKSAKEYPKNSYGEIDLNLINSCKREYVNNKEFCYFSVVYSSREIYRVKNEESLKRWIKVINESVMFCKYWKNMKEKNKKANDYLKKQKDIIEIVEQNGQIKNYEEEQKKKDDEIKAKEREKILKTLNEGDNNLQKREKYNLKDYNRRNSSNSMYKKINLDLIDDSNKKGINTRAFEKIDLQYNYMYGSIFKVRLMKKFLNDDNNANVNAKANVNDKAKANIKNNNNNNALILKKISKKEIFRLKHLKSVENEINLIKQCDCPFILNIIYSFQDKRSIYMVEEFCPGGNLKWHINSNLFEEEEAKFYIAELILAIEYLHKKNIVYKNLKSEKILINKDNHIQLCGFGLVKEDKDNKDNDDYDDVNNFFGTKDDYISPELLTLIGEYKMADIYGIGVVLYEMVCGTKPFYLKENMTLYNDDDDLNKKKLMMNEYLSRSLKDLLTTLLCKNPKDRIEDIGEIKKHKFFKDIDWVKLGKLQIIPPVNLVKNKLDNKNNSCFRRKIIKKNEKKDYFIGFSVVKKIDQFTFVRKYVSNEKKKKDYLINTNSGNFNINEKNNNVGENNDSIIINLKDNYIEKDKKEEEIKNEEDKKGENKNKEDKKEEIKKEEIMKGEEKENKEKK